MAQEKETNKKRLTGVVQASKMPKTAVVKVSFKFAHPLYRKVIETWKKYHVHTEVELVEGDIVIIEEAKPISKTKRWRVIKKIEKKN
jgi:small subunit ribosomal protein S17